MPSNVPCNVGNERRRNEHEVVSGIKSMPKCGSQVRGHCCCESGFCALGSQPQVDVAPQPPRGVDVPVVSHLLEGLRRFQLVNVDVCDALPLRLPVLVRPRVPQSSRIACAIRKCPRKVVLVPLEVGGDQYVQKAIVKRLLQPELLRPRIFERICLAEHKHGHARNRTGKLLGRGCDRVLREIRIRGVCKHDVIAYLKRRTREKSTEKEGESKVLKWRRKSFEGIALLLLCALFHPAAVFDVKRKRTKLHAEDHQRAGDVQLVAAVVGHLPVNVARGKIQEVEPENELGSTGEAQRRERVGCNSDSKSVHHLGAKAHKAKRNSAKNRKDVLRCGGRHCLVSEAKRIGEDQTQQVFELVDRESQLGAHGLHRAIQCGKQRGQALHL
eukprot:Opistho-2@42681